ncbi:MAG TPA: glycoside hydrolase family 2 TIM barrel-domain containing protein [Conexibacter sp.]|jgi:beta-glucuronidase
MRRRPSFPARLLALLLALSCAIAVLPAVATADDEPPPDTTTGGTNPFTVALAPPSTDITVPSGKPLFMEGQDSRYLIDGPWMFREDPTDVGVSQRWFAATTPDGWSGTTVPSVWNVGGTTTAQFEGSVGWYRKDFELPRARPTDSWVIRFEAVNYRATVWLNGRQIGQHVGGYTPFEVTLPNVSRNGVNHLVVRVDNRRALPPGGGSQPVPPTGWWNYGGMQREVYLRRVDRVDIQDVFVDPELPRVGGPAQVTATATLRNTSRTAQLVTLSGRFGRLPMSFGSVSVPAGGSSTLTARLTVRKPRLWSTASPSLYRVRLAATAMAPRARRATPAAAYTLESGIRQLIVKNGQLLLNGDVVHFRGVAIHEDTLDRGSAMSNDDRQKLMALVRDSGATLVRAHYPLHPELEELADRMGILLWNEIPTTYQLPDTDLGRSVFRRQALQELRENILANRNHPAIAVWSVGNEMPSKAGPNQTWYIRTAADLVHQLKPGALAGLAYAGHPETACQPAYAPVDVLGMNDYFGWYTGFGGNIADRDGLDSYLDYVHNCYRKQAVAVTEFGAEANRDGPADEKGTYAFQSDFLSYHLAEYATKPWLAGSVYFSLQEFRIRDGWGGGNPWSDPPFHQKGLVRLDFTKKPAYDVLQASFRSTRQYVPRGGTSARAVRPGSATPSRKPSKTPRA